MNTKVVIAYLLASQTALAQSWQRLADPVAFDILPQAVRSAPNLAKNLPKTTASSTLLAENISSATLSVEQQINNAILQQNWQTLPALLAQYTQQPDYDQALLHYAQGAQFYAQRQYSKAIAHYQQFLTLKPNLAYPRFDYAVMLFEDHQYSQAKTAFQKSYPELAPEMQRFAQQYLNAIIQQQSWQADFQLQYVQTNNVNNAAAAKTIKVNGLTFVKDADSLPKKANGLRYGLGLAREMQIIGHHFGRIELDYRGLYYWNQQDYNEQSARLGAGYTYRNAKHTFSVTPFIEQNWFGSARYQRQFGATISHSLALSPQWKLNHRFLHSQKRYQEPLIAARHNGYQQQLTSDIQWQVNKNWQLFANMSLIQDKAKEKASASRRWLAKAGVNYQRHQWGSQISLGYGKRYFDDVHYLYRYKRQDQERQLSAALWHNRFAWRGFMPKLNFRYQQTQSNMPDLYSLSHSEWFITLEKTF